MAERKTRFYMTKKVWAQSAEEIQNATFQLMESQGLECFKSLTIDNGAEFSTPLPLVLSKKCFVCKLT